MPARPVKNEGGMSARRDVLGYLRQMEAHSVSVDVRQDQPCGEPTRRASCAEDIAPGEARVARGSGARAFAGPFARNRALLANARFILEPNLQRLAPGMFGQG